MQPVIREAAKRGLAWFDDGAAPRSLAGQIAQSQAMPFAKADLTIDTVPTAVEIDRALAQLETLARQRGVAVGAPRRCRSRSTASRHGSRCSKAAASCLCR